MVQPGKTIELFVLLIVPMVVLAGGCIIASEENKLQIQREAMSTGSDSGNKDSKTHLNSKGYNAWTGALKPIVKKAFEK
jgi:lysophospholipase L1-like esterase